MSGNYDKSLSVLYICLKNLAVFAGFLYAAIYFNHWWIVLISFLFQSSVEWSSDDSSYLECEFCKSKIQVLNPKSKLSVVRDVKSNGWAYIHVPDSDEVHVICPRCSSMNKSNTEES